jgi:glycosyltransferase involved in cell wall biosynthesis
VKNQQPLITVVTPTIGRPELVRAMKSVAQCARNLDQGWVEHLIVVDGPKWRDGVNAAMAELPQNQDARSYRHEILSLPYPTCRSGGVCRAMGCLMARGRYVAFLDDDNWYDPQHLSRCFDTLNEHPELDWMHTGRWMVPEGSYDPEHDKVEDMSGSLGLLHEETANRFHHLVDTNCFFLRREVAHCSANKWCEGPRESWGEDRAFFWHLALGYRSHAFYFKPTVYYLARPGLMKLTRAGNQRTQKSVARHHDRLINLRRRRWAAFKVWLITRAHKRGMFDEAHAPPGVSITPR